MRILPVVVVLLLLIISPACAEQTPSQLGLQAAKLRKLSYKPVAGREMSQEQASNYLMKLLDKELEPKLTLARQTFLKRLGLMPQNSTIRGILAKLYASQVRGIYDPHKKLFIVVKNKGSEQSAIDVAAAMVGIDIGDTYTVHELEHAIQDQHFNLNRISQAVAKDGDRSFAAQSVIEGDATLVMTNYTMQKAGLAGQDIDLSNPGLGGLTEKDLKDLGLDQMGLDLESLQGQTSPSLAGAPLYFQESLSAPYNQGMAFVSTLKKRGGWPAVNQAFRQLPKSSEQIYHPEKYFGPKDLPKKVSLQHLPAKVGPYKLVTEDTAGEFTVRVLAKQYKQPISGAEGWGGDRYRVYHSGKYGFAVWHTKWDSPKDAKEFLRLIKPILAQRQLVADRKRSKAFVYGAYSSKTGINVLLGVPRAYLATLK